MQYRGTLNYCYKYSVCLHVFITCIYVGIIGVGYIILTDTYYHNTHLESLQTGHTSKPLPPMGNQSFYSRFLEPILWYPQK